MLLESSPYKKQVLSWSRCTVRRKRRALVLLALFSASVTVLQKQLCLLQPTLFFPAYPYAGTRWKILPALSWKLCLLKSCALIPLDLITTRDAEINLNWDDCEAESGSLWGNTNYVYWNPRERRKRNLKYILNKFNILKFKALAEDVKLFWVKTIFCDCLTLVSILLFWNPSLKNSCFFTKRDMMFFPDCLMLLVKLPYCHQSISEP